MAIANHTSSQATSASQWTSAARELDHLEGNHFWQSEENGVNGIYRPDVIRERMRELNEARINCNIRRMVHLVRTALSRDLGGMGNIDLYKHSYIGTKDLIEQYVDTAVRTIEDLVEKSGYPGALPADLDHTDILEAFLQARQSFGRSALLLSGGGTFGMMHAGVVKAMFEADLLPRIISGASAGSIVCAVFCTRTADEVPDVIKDFPYGDLNVFEEQGKEESILDHVKRLLTEGSWSDIKHLTRVMRNMLGDITFQEAYNRTRKICNISVSTESIYELPRLLNYITAPNVMIWSAVAASCSVPLVFSAAPLLVKDPVTGEHLPWNPTPERWVDGSVDNDLPMTRLAEMFNVNHFIVSQVNPHVVPFLSRDDRLYPEHEGSRPDLFGTSHNVVTNTLTTLAKDEALHRLQFLAELHIFPTTISKLRSVLSQKYSGDITILPEFNVNDLPRILKNPDVEFMERSTLSGERATWPRLSRIRDRCVVELAIDRSIQALRARCIFSQSQVNLRRLATVADPYASLKTSIAQSFSNPFGPELDQAQARNTSERAKMRGQRRGSGGSLQMLTQHRKHLLAMDTIVTDDDTEEEERLELSLRRGATTLSLTGRANVIGNKSRTRRGPAKTVPIMPVSISNLGPLTSPIPAHISDDSEFDFSKPLGASATTKALIRNPPSMQRDLAAAVGSSSSPSPHFFKSLITMSRSSPHLPSTSSPRLEVISPITGDLETSDVHTTDAEMDSRTDDSMSDPEPYSQVYSAPLKTDASDDSMNNIGACTITLKGCTISPSAAALADDEQDTTDTGEGLWD